MGRTGRQRVGVLGFWAGWLFCLQWEQEALVTDAEVVLCCPRRQQQPALTPPSLSLPQGLDVDPQTGAILKRTAPADRLRLHVRHLAFVCSALLCAVSHALRM